MEKQIGNLYLKGLFEHFEKNKAKFFNVLPNIRITEGMVNNLYDLKKIGVIEEVDRKIIEDFENKRKDLIQPFRVIANFLNQNTYNINEEFYINLLAFLLDYEPRPLDEFHRRNIKPNKVIEKPKADDKKPKILVEAKQPKQIKTETTAETKPEQSCSRFSFFGLKRIYTALVVIIVLLVAILLSGIFSSVQTNRTDTQIDSGNINVQNKNYYYLDSSSIKLHEKTLDDKNTNTTKPAKIDCYVIDPEDKSPQTAPQLIKTGYITNYPEESQRKLHLIGKEGEEKTIRKQANLNNNAKKSILKVTNNGKPDQSVENLFKSLPNYNKIEQVNAQTKYFYKKSSIASGHSVCEIQLNGKMQARKGFKNINLQAIGNGQDKLSARNNALMKLELLLKEETK